MTSPTITPLGRSRLEKLAKHLEKGKLGHDVFAFDEFHARRDCKTLGCALGECPFIFEEWVFDGDEPALGMSSSGNATWDASTFFWIDKAAVAHLFMPGAQRTIRCGGERLTASATRYQVASNIRAFLALANNEQH